MGRLVGMLIIAEGTRDRVTAQEPVQGKFL